MPSCKNSKNQYVTNTVGFDVNTHNPAGYTLINRNDKMIVHPHNTLATDQPTSTQRTLQKWTSWFRHVGFSTFLESHFVGSLVKTCGKNSI